MTEQDKKEMLELIKQALAIVMKKQKEDFHQAMGEQTEKYLEVLKPYEKLIEKHDKKLNKMGDILKE